VRHLALPRFWTHYRKLPEEVRKVADQNFERLKADPRHPSLHFKKVGRTKQLWSVRVGEHYRALGVDKPEGVVWFWIGPHSEYDHLLS
jgi:mRNA-degrading endonuclease RelE of RelBE toxin-antitoxin system